MRSWPKLKRRQLCRGMVLFSPENLYANGKVVVQIRVHMDILRLFEDQGLLGKDLNFNLLQALQASCGSSQQRGMLGPPASGCIGAVTFEKYLI